MRSPEPRKFVLSCHSTMPVTLEPAPVPPQMLATAAIQLAIRLALMLVVGVAVATPLYLVALATLAHTCVALAHLISGALCSDPPPARSWAQLAERWRQGGGSPPARSWQSPAQSPGPHAEPQHVRATGCRIRQPWLDGCDDRRQRKSGAAG